MATRVGTILGMTCTFVQIGRSAASGPILTFKWGPEYNLSPDLRTDCLGLNLFC